MESYKVKEMLYTYRKLTLYLFLICFPPILLASITSPVSDWSHSTNSHAIQKLVLPKPKGHVNLPQLTFSSDNSIAAAFIRDPSQLTSLLVWSTDNGGIIASTEFPLEHSPADFGELVFTPDNKHLVYTQYTDGDVSFSWDFRQNKRSKLRCFLGSTLTHVTNNSVLARPSDWVEHLHDLKSCEIIALSPIMGNRMVIGKDNKLLWIAYRKVSEELKRQWFYLEPSFDSRSFKKKYGHAVDLMGLKSDVSRDDYDRPYERILYNHTKYELLLEEYDKSKVKLSLWDYAKKKNIWKNTFDRDDLFTQIQGSLQPVKKLYLDTDFKQRRAYLVGRKFLEIIDLDSGKVIKRIAFPKGSITSNWSEDFEEFNFPFFIGDNGKKIILKHHNALEILNLENGSILTRLDTDKLTSAFRSQIKHIKTDNFDRCKSNQWHCLFKAQRNISPNARYISFGKDYALPNQREFKVWHSNIIADTVTSEPLIQLHQQEITEFVKTKNGTTLFLSSSDKAPHDLVLWKIKPLGVAKQTSE